MAKKQKRRLRRRTAANAGPSGPPRKLASYPARENPSRENPSRENPAREHLSLQPDSGVFQVGEDSNQSTLAAFLRERSPGRSWSQVRSLIENRRVQVNGNLCTDAGRRLKPGDAVKLFAHSLAKPPSESDVAIRYLDAHLVIVEKPAGMTTLRHSEERNWSERRRQFQPTLDEVLPRVLAQRQARGPGRGGPRKRSSPRPRAVHRLDRDTSGLMVFALTHEAERLLVGKFRQHDIERAYRAVVHGTIEPQTIESILVRDRGDGRRGSFQGEQGDVALKQGQRAVTHVRPLETLGDYSIVECRLETGRTHQIRIHLSEAGCRLCGETIYNRDYRRQGHSKSDSAPRFGKPKEDKSGAPRLALHAFRLGFEHPITGETLRFESPWPPDLAEFVARLRDEPKSGEIRGPS